MLFILKYLSGEGAVEIVCTLAVTKVLTVVLIIVQAVGILPLLYVSKFSEYSHYACKLKLRRANNIVKMYFIRLLISILGERLIFEWSKV